MRAAELYDKDFAEWARHNAELLRGGRASEADLEHIAEEIEDLGKRERRSLHNRSVRLHRAPAEVAVPARTARFEWDEDDHPPAPGHPAAAQRKPEFPAGLRGSSRGGVR